MPRLHALLAAYIRHLVNQDEILGLRLLTLHNVAFLLALTRRARGDRRGRLDAVHGRGAGPARRCPEEPVAHLILLALFVVVWLFLIRPQRQPAEAAGARPAVAEGAEILTVGGIYGTVLELATRTTRARDRRGT